MKRILAIDFGLVRCGLAVTDPMQIIASPLDTIETTKLKHFLHEYVKKEALEVLVIGRPKHLNGEEVVLVEQIDKLALDLAKAYPFLKIHFVDERFTSKMASLAIAQSDLPKLKRQQKGLIDKVSAALILQSYLDQR